MTDAILTPLDFSEPQRVGRRRFWKQILPVTSIDYDGKKINFDPEFHQDLQLAFKQGAFDQVPLVFAGNANDHNMDPRNFGGDIIDLQYRGEDSGTWALIEADKEAARVIRRNPKLGVSARILQGYRNAAGKTFKRAVNHVLLTMNPRVRGMQPWQAVDLSEDADIEVVDLTAETFEEGTGMRTKTKSKAKATDERRQIDLSALNDEEFETLIDLATTAGVLEADTDEDVVDPDAVEDDDTETERVPRKKKSKTKITVEKESEDDGDGDGDDEDTEDDDASTDLSERRPAKRRRYEDPRVRVMQIDLAQQRWDSDREDYLRDGVPPFLLDLAGPILASPDVQVIDLADGETTNPAKVIRDMLDGFKGLIDLSPDLGHMIDLTDAKVEDDDAAAFIKEWDKVAPL